MNSQSQAVSISEVVDSEAFILESIGIFFDPLGEGLTGSEGPDAFNL